MTPSPFFIHPAWKQQGSTFKDAVAARTAEVAQRQAQLLMQRFAGQSWDPKQSKAKPSGVVRQTFTVTTRPFKIKQDVGVRPNIVRSLATMLPRKQAK